MVELLLSPQSAPFAVALMIMVFIALLEGVGLVFGVAISELVDSLLPDLDIPDVEFEADANPSAPELNAVTSNAGPLTQFLGWLCFGRVPALILLIAFLLSFGLSGLAVQGVTQGVLGTYLPAWLAAAAALTLSLPATRRLGLLLAKIMPKEETEAVSQDNFVGKIAVIIRGVAKRGLPSEAKLKDRHGQTHYVLVEPDRDDEEFAAGREVLVVRRVGAVFRVIENEHDVLSRTQ